MDRVYGEQSEETDRERKATAPAPPTSEVLDLQRSAGNAAVARMLARQPAPAASIVPDLSQPSELTLQVSQAYATVEKWLVGLSNARRQEQQGGDGSLTQSVAELVQMARELTFKRSVGLDLVGKEHRVGDLIGNTTLEEHIRRVARNHGIGFVEHQSLADPVAAKAEAKAVLSNAGAELPSSFELEVDGKSGKVKVSAGGDIELGVKAGSAELEGKAELDAEKGLKAVKGSLKVGTFLEIQGSVKKGEGGKWLWAAELQIGTLGGIVTPEDVAKVMLGLQKTMSEGGKAVAGGSGPGQLGLHAVEVQNAVGEVVEKVKKSAAQNKPGAQLGFKLESDEKGGVSGGFTFTWRF